MYNVCQEDEFRRRREAMIVQQRREAYNVLRQLEEMRSQPPNGIVSIICMSVICRYKHLLHCADVLTVVMISS